MRLRPRDPPDARRGGPPPEGDRPIRALLLAHRALEERVARFAASPETFDLVKYEVGLLVAAAALAAAVTLRRRGRPVLLAALVGYAIALGHAAQFPPTEGDESEYVLLAAAIPRAWDTRIDDDILDGTLEEATGKVPANFAPIRDDLLAGRRTGPVWSYRPPAVPLLLAPGYALGRAFGASPHLRWFLASLPLAAAGAAAAAAMNRLGLGGLPLLGLAAAAPLVHFSLRPMPEIVGAALAAWALALAFEPADRRRGLLLGLLVGVMPLVHFRHAYVAVPLALLCLARLRGARAAVAVGLALGASAAAAAYVAASRSAAPGGGLEFGAPVWTAAGAPGRLVALLVGRLPGLLGYAPIAAVALFGLRASAPARAGAAIFALYVALMAGYRNAHESFPFARYLVVALPLLSPAVAAGARRLDRTRAGRAAVAALCLYGAARGLLAAAAPLSWRFGVFP